MVLQNTKQSKRKPEVRGTSDFETQLLRSESSRSSDSYSSSMRATIGSRDFYEPISTSSSQGSYDSYNSYSGGSSDFSNSFPGRLFGSSRDSSMRSYDSGYRSESTDSSAPCPERWARPDPIKLPGSDWKHYGQQVESPIEEEWNSEDLPALYKEIDDITEMYKHQSMSGSSRKQSDRSGSKRPNYSCKNKAQSSRKNQSTTSSVGNFGPFQDASRGH